MSVICCLNVLSMLNNNLILQYFKKIFILSFLTFVLKQSQSGLSLKTGSKPRLYV